MISKNSFLVNLKENNKRRVWLWILSCLCWFIYYPVAAMMLISRQKNYNLMMMYTEEAAKEALINVVKEWLDFGSGGLMLLVSLMAAVCAIQGFSYLHHRKKVDFYHSIPVKKSRRFLVIYINGVLIFLVPYALNLLLALIVSGVNGAMNGENAAAAARCLLYALLLFLATYGLMLIAVMMTGNIVITVCASVIFLVYEFVVRGILKTYCINFYQYFSDESMNVEPLLSPARQMIKFLDENGSLSSWTAAMPLILLETAMAVGFTGIAWFCYKKRPAEAAGKAMAFAKTKGVVKILLVIPFALGTGLFMQDIIGETPYGMMFFGMVMAVIIGSCAIEVIYEMDIRAVFRRKYQMLISGACVAAVFLVFSLDLTGYDEWVPDPEKLEEAYFMFIGDIYGTYVDKDFQALDSGSYCLTKPGIKDIDAVCRLSEKKTDEGNLWCKVAYRMKSGKIVWRWFAVSHEEEELLNRIVGSQEYKNMKCQLSDDAVYAAIKEMKVTDFQFSTGFKRENLNAEDLDGFREAYLKDLGKADYSMFKKETVCGNIKFLVTKQVEYGTNSRWFEYEIYPSYDNTIAFLKEKGVYDKCCLNTDEIAGIMVTNYHNEEYEAAMRGGASDMEAALSMGRGDYSVTKTFYEEEQIKELLPAVYPDEFDTYWNPKGTVSGNYRVVIYYKDGMAGTAHYRGNNEARLVTERIPAWLEKETAYQ